MPEANPRLPFALTPDLPALPPFQGKRVVVNVATNVEHWPFDRPMPRAILPAPHGAPPPVPDIPNWTWVEYGLRAGMPRLLDLHARLGLPCSALLNASVCTHYPRLAEAMLKAGWEFVGHGLYQRSLVSVEDQEGWVAESLSTLRAFSGQPVRAWLGPGLGEKSDTPDVLARHGIRYLHDWLVEDEPLWMPTTEGPIVAVPYTVELNDVPMYLIQNQRSDEMLARVRATLALFARDGFARTRVVTLALHPHIVGVPHRMEFLAQTLEELAAHPEVAFATSSEIGAWYEAQVPPPAA